MISEERKLARRILHEEFAAMANSWFVGIAIPHQPTMAEGVYGPIHSEKVLKFNRAALLNRKAESDTIVNPRLWGSDDTMRFPVGKPGSQERIDALTVQYASLSDEESSPFSYEE